MVTIQGRRFCPDIGLIEQLLAENPGWGRSRLSVKLCELWDWRAANGQLRDMACRSLLLRLEKAGHITLPPRQRKSPNGYRNRSPIWVAHRTEAIEGALRALTPLQITCAVNASEHDQLFRCLLCAYHYLGLRNTAGENMKYLVHSRDGQPLACLLFGAAAFKCGARDAWIGWPAPVRERNPSGFGDPPSISGILSSFSERHSREAPEPHLSALAAHGNPEDPLLCTRRADDKPQPVSVFVLSGSGRFNLADQPAANAPYLNHKYESWHFLLDI